MNFENLSAALHIGGIHLIGLKGGGQRTCTTKLAGLNLTIEAARSNQGLIQDVSSVGGRNHNDPLVALEASRRPKKRDTA